MISRDTMVMKLLRNTKLSNDAKLEVIRLLYSEECGDVSQNEGYEDKQSMDNWKYDNTKQEKVKVYMEHMPKDGSKELYQSSQNEDNFVKKLSQDELIRTTKDYDKYKKSLDKMTKKMKRSFKLVKDKQFNDLVDKHTYELECDGGY